MDEQEHTRARRRMVAEQIAARGVRDQRILEAMGAVPRHGFLAAQDLPWAYSDGPMPIGHGQTISQPYVVARMTELLEIQPGDRLLEVGTGCGYQAAVLGLLAETVHTVEIIPELARQAGKTLSDLGYTNVYVHAGDGSNGWPEAAPYAGILVAAAAPSAPQPLLDQLAEGGRLVLPIGSAGFQQLEIWQRKGSGFDHRVDLAVAFVPLRGRHGWK
jgi:protein-L-isoaspartate(D-aspartate) O-methyltransferase